MAYVTTAWGRPIQGVSQQPDRIRQEGQCTKQENGIPDVVKGLTKRPALNFIKKLLNRSISSYSAFHSYDRGDEQYFMFVEPNSETISIFDTQGNLQNLSVTHGSYLNVDRPDLNLDFTTVADYTFITNKTIKVAMDDEVAPNPYEHMGIVYSQYATYGKDYKILVNGAVLASYQTPDGSESGHVYFVKTDWIANVLYTQIVGGSYTGTGGEVTFPPNPDYTATLVDNTIWISRRDGADFKLTTADSQKGEDLIAVKGSVKTTTSLPPYAPDGFVVRITGAGKSSKDDYWLKAENKQGETQVRWVESAEPGVLTKFNVDTMPHVLVRESITTEANFNFRQGEYEPREIGGDDSNPLPAFVDKDNPQSINSTGVFQNRLFFLSGETVIMSRSNLFFNFWRETTQTASDSDPLEGYADTDRVNNLYNYQILNGDLVIFSDKAQFIIKGSSPVTKANLTLSQVTAYPSLTNIKPQAAGENVFFGYDASGYTGVRELFTDNYADTKKAYPATDYVSKYIPGDCIQMLATPNLNSMVIRARGNLSNLYMYDWLWQDNQKVQSAWHKWIMDGEVLYVFYVDDLLYVVYQKNGLLFLDYLHLLNDPETVNLNYSTKLDHKVSVNATYYPDIGKYRFTLPYDRSDVVCTLSTGCYPEDEGSAFVADYIGNGVWESSDDLSPSNGDLQVVCGVPFKFSYIPTQPVVKDQRERVIGLQSIIMSNLYIHYEVTGDIKLTVRPNNGRSRDYHFSGRYVGTQENLVGSPVLDNGTYRVPIRQRAEAMEIEIFSSSHYPLTIRDMEMDGTFHQRGQRI